MSPPDPTPTLTYVYLPFIAKPYTCPITSTNQYSGGIAYQYDRDNPVHPAYNHADKNIELRGYILNTDPNLQRGLVDYGSGDPTQPPQFATLFAPYRVPTFINFYQVHNWICTDPNLLALYNALDDPNGPRYEFPNPSYELPNLYAGQPFGTARSTEIVVAIADTGVFMDPRSCNEWWRIRPGYSGSCPPGERSCEWGYRM